MQCPVCGSVLPAGGVCPRCHLDTALYQKVRLTAAKLYNKGLSQAREGDLSGAELSLLNSLKFDKRNCEARNLLGLVYYRRGRMADALKHWIISTSLEDANNPARGYIDDLQAHGRALEQANDAVRMFNLARRYLIQGSDDLAMIQLKKAINLSPYLSEARNLLALCYIRAGEENRAIPLLERVLRQDSGNPLAKHLLELLGRPVREPVREVKKPPREPRAASLRDVPPNRAQKALHQKRITEALQTSRRRLLVITPAEILAFGLGILITAVVSFTLIFPALSDGKNREISQLTDQLAQSETARTALSEQTNKLSNETKRLQAQLDEYQNQSDVVVRQTRLTQAQSLIGSGDYGNAALLLLELDVSDLPAAAQAAYEAAKEASFGPGARSFYQAAMTAYQSGDLTTAETNFENALKLANADTDFVPEALYYMAYIAESKNEADRAKTYWERIVNEYPESAHGEEARERLGMP